MPWGGPTQKGAIPIDLSAILTILDLLDLAAMTLGSHLKLHFKVQFELTIK